MDKNMDIENQKHIKKVYSDKASNLLKFCIIILIFSGITYLFGILAYQSFDFGLIFEIISFVFILLSHKKIKQKDFSAAKKNIIIAMIPLGWLIIYDLINLIVNIGEVLPQVISYFLSFDSLFYYLEPYLYDVTSVATLILLYKSFSSLNKATGNIESNNYTDTFYDEL